MTGAPQYGRDAVVGRRPRSARSVPRVRAELRRAPAGWGLYALEDRAALVLTELLTNAVRHARAPRGVPPRAAGPARLCGRNFSGESGARQVRVGSESGANH